MGLKIKRIMAPKPPYTIDAPKFDPDNFIDQWSKSELGAPKDDDHDLETAIRRAFSLPTKDSYVYHATASVTLAQVQKVIAAGSQHGLHAWYRDDEWKEVNTIIGSHLFHNNKKTNNTQSRPHHHHQPT